MGAGDKGAVEHANGHGHVLIAQEGQNLQQLAVRRQQEGGEGTHQNQQNGNQQNGHGHHGPHFGLVRGLGRVFRQLGIQVGEVPFLSRFLVLPVDKAAIDNAAHEHAHKGGDQRVKEEDAHVDVHSRSHRQRRRGGQDQSKGAGGGHRNGAAIGGHGVAGFAGEHPEHGGEHDVYHITEDRDAGDEAGHRDGILRTLGAHGLEHLVHDVVDAAGLIHEHAQHNAQAGDNADGAQGGAKIACDAGSHIRDGREIFRRAPARIGGQSHQTRAVGADQQSHKGVELDFDDTEQQHCDGDQENKKQHKMNLPFLNCARTAAPTQQISDLPSQHNMSYVICQINSAIENHLWSYRQIIVLNFVHNKHHTLYFCLIIFILHKYSVDFLVVFPA